MLLETSPGAQAPRHALGGENILVFSLCCLSQRRAERASTSHSAPLSVTPTARPSPTSQCAGRKPRATGSRWNARYWNPSPLSVQWRSFEHLLRARYQKLSLWSALWSIMCVYIRCLSWKPFEEDGVCTLSLNPRGEAESGEV